MTYLVEINYGGAPLEEDVAVRRKDIHDLLKTNVASVAFTKVNGEERVMRCTLKEDLLPARVITEDAAERAENETILNVWDVDAAGWRSFRIANVRSVKVEA